MSIHDFEPATFHVSIGSHEPVDPTYTIVAKVEKVLLERL